MSKTPKQLTLTGDFLTVREQRELSPFAARSDRSRGRRHDEPEHPYRSIYMRDRDRIIHCTAFRRLEYKTQVFVNHEGDYYRTRLTHTMEVAQIARIIARILRVNEDLTEAIALAHDIGHTPFGHSGEDALNELMQADGGFEHNLHGLRVVDFLERRYPDFPGLNLTYEVREAIAKHHTSYDHPARTDEFDLSERALVEAQIVEVADVIAYHSHDVDDGLKSGLLRERDLNDVGLWQLARRAVTDRYGELRAELRRVQTVRHIINMEVTDALEATEFNLNWVKLKDARDARKLEENVVGFSKKFISLKDELEDFLMDKLYRHHRVLRMANKARRFLKEIFGAYVADVRQLPEEYQHRVKEEETLLLAQREEPAPDEKELEAVRQRAARRVVCDYVAGMTDRYAQEDYLKLFAPGERV
ncbi:MAG TPA: deoxyguanosinetriphosphate triphosphohydrolase [Planctomycetota bacterium]|nr:deoxyguanosinetriphosphate triphosphohydrolase [Planctomycetota bacterium]